MQFESANPSVIRSIRQRDLLQAWIRLFAVRKQAPRFDDYDPDRLDDELPELMYYDVDHHGSSARFKIAHEGQRFRDVFGITGIGQYLDQLEGFVLTQATQSLYREACLRLLPAYSITLVQDREGRPVTWERLLLPFCEDGRATVLMASLKPVSTEGRFETRGLMTSNQGNRRYQVYAIIDQGLVARRTVRRHGPNEEIV
jgi:hypothetical protein